MRLFLLPSIFFAIQLTAQIPNAGFEDWADGVPVGWSTNNVAPLSFTPITQSNQAHSGASAVRGEVVENPVLSMPTPPVMQNAAEIPVAGMVTNVQGYYQFFPVDGTTSMSVSVTALDADDMLTGFGVALIYDEQSTYALFSVPIDYSIGTDEPTTKLVIAFGIADDLGFPAEGSYLLIDDLTLDGTTALTDLSANEKLQLFPNPCQDELYLDIEDDGQIMEYQIISLSGAIVQSGRLNSTVENSGIVSLRPEGALENGMYVLRVVSEGNSVTSLFELRR